MTEYYNTDFTEVIIDNNIYVADKYDDFINYYKKDTLGNIIWSKCYVAYKDIKRIRQNKLNNLIMHKNNHILKIQEIDKEIKKMQDMDRDI